MTRSTSGNSVPQADASSGTPSLSRSLRAAWWLAAGTFLLGLAVIPVFVLLYAAVGALFGLAILLTLALIQLPLYLLVRKWLPSVDRRPVDLPSEYPNP